jgi:CBS domain-containing protein
MNVSEVMTAQVATAKPDTTIRAVGKMMAEVDTGVIPIADGGQVIGLVTDRDIVLRAVAEGADLDAPVSTIMTGDVESCREDDNIADATAKMARLQIRRLIVLSESGSLAGIVSLGDIAKDYGAKKVGQTLEEISEQPSMH